MEAYDREAFEMSDDGDGDWSDEEGKYFKDMFDHVEIDWHDRSIWDSDQESNDE